MSSVILNRPRKEGAQKYSYINARSHPIHDVCFELDKPYVYASASQFQGYCSIFYGSKGPCFRCLFPMPPSSDTIPNCDTGGVLGVLPGLLGVIQAAEITKWILKIGSSLEKRLLMIDLLKMSFKEVRLSQNLDCKLCVHHQSLSIPIRWFFGTTIFLY